MLLQRLRKAQAAKDANRAEQICKLRQDGAASQDARFKCPTCANSFRTEAALKRHQRDAHGQHCDTRSIFDPTRDSLKGTSTCAHCGLHLRHKTSPLPNVRPRLSFYMMVGPLVFCRASQALWLQPCRDAAPASIAGSSSSATTRVPSLRRCLPRASTSTPSQRADKADFICFQDADFTCPSSRRSISYARALREAACKADTLAWRTVACSLSVILPSSVS
ncbi:unnamed protein product [Symbiodinium sp. KB8]|nr:unnamed protein product [Symbiodinium sp. KB8]